MCGIAGFTDTNNCIRDPSNLIQNITASLAHRGPDDSGFLLDTDAHVFLGHRRLSIVDLNTGQQPIHNEDRSIHVIANGEIYNFKKLKTELEHKGHFFYTKSDCEVLVHLYEEHGINFVDKLEGMYAFAIWDQKQKKLCLARDRYGEKPLYYFFKNNDLFFASELKALLKCPCIRKELDIIALQKYLAYEYIPAPLSIIKDVFKLDAAEILEYDLVQNRVSKSKYWLPFANPPSSLVLNFDQAKNRFESLLVAAIEKRLMSDVPLGVFLSGGLDSSSIAFMIANIRGNANFKTFSIAFQESSFDESAFARLVAEKLGTKHFEETLTINKMLDILPEITAFMDEPFSDASIIPTYLLSKFTRNHVKVAISGDGSDELLLGYPTFLASKCANFYSALIPQLISQKIVGPIINALPTRTNNFSFDFKLKQFMKGMLSNSEFR